jgi:hypothetical protein
MRISAQDELSWQDHGFLAQDLMADPTSYFEEVADTLLLYKPADLGVVLGMFGRGCRHGVIKGDGHLFWDYHTSLAELEPCLADGGGIVVAQHDIWAHIHHLTYFDKFKTRRPGNGLLCKRLGRWRFHLWLCRFQVV